MRKLNRIVISGHKSGKSMRGFLLLSIFDFGIRQILFLQRSRKLEIFFAIIKGDICR